MALVPPPPSPSLITPGPAPAAPAPPKDDPELAAALGEVGKAYPALAPYAAGAVARRGVTDDDRQLEFYGPNEDDNPNPGKSTLEIYNKGLKGRDLTEAMAGDLLHYVTSLNPDGTPVNPEVRAIHQQMKAGMIAADHPFDWQDYVDTVARYGPQDYDAYLEHNRVPAYLRGAAFPSQNPEWQRPGIYTPEMTEAGAKLKAWLAGPPPPPAPPPPSVTYRLPPTRRP